MWFVSTLRWVTAQFKPITVSLICQCAEKHTDFAYGTGELSAWVMRKHLIRRDENRARDCSARCRSWANRGKDSQPIPKAGIGDSPRFAEHTLTRHFRESPEFAAYRGPHPPKPFKHPSTERPSADA